MSDYGDQVILARLFENEREGQSVLRRRLGMAKVAVLKSKETAENGDAIWNVVIGEGQNDKRPAPRQLARLCRPLRRAAGQHG